MPELPGLADFSTYDLSRVAEHMVEQSREHPAAPATSALRAACVARLSWDMAWRSCWADPTFLPRFLFLRRAIVSTHAGEAITVTDAIPVVDELVQEAVRLEYSFTER